MITRSLSWPELSRRGFLISAAAAGLQPLKGQTGAPACLLASEQEEGPYYVDGAKLRRDITEGKAGVPLTLRVLLIDSKRCAPLSNAALDIWHCDAGGVYSAFESAGGGRGFGRGRGPGGPPPGNGDGPPQLPPPEMRGFGPGGPPPGGRGPRVVGSTRFLRGLQMTNAKGLAEFATVYPGWYEGRTIHIHLKVHLGGDHAEDTYNGGHVCHTGQFFFPEDVTERIAKLQPYVKHSAVHRTLQEEDGVFRSQHGSSSIVQLEKASGASGAEAYVATVTVAVDPDLTPRPVGPGGGRGPGRGPGGPPPFPR